MWCLSPTLLLVFIASHQALGTEPYAASGVNKALSSQNVSIFGPSPLDDLNLEVNNLQVTSLANDKRYVYFSFAAYCTEEDVKNWDCHYCQILGPNIRYITEIVRNVEGTKAYFAVDTEREEIVLVFRGSLNVGNAILDSTFVPVSVSNDSDSEDIRLHAGFYKATLSLYDEVVDELRILMQSYPSFKVVITGHSLGAAEASITLFLFKFHDVFPETTFELYTYGGPRHGNRAYATYFNSMDIPVARAVHGSDFAAHVIPTNPIGYVHHQNEVWEVSPEDVRKDCSRFVYEDLACSDSQAHVFSVPDHLFYFGINVMHCVTEDSASLLLQIPVNLKRFVSTEQIPRQPGNPFPRIANSALIRPILQKSGR